MEKRNFIPTRLGVAVCDYLVDHFPGILDVEFTARMEEDLDTVEQGERDWVALLREFYGPLEERLAQVKTEPPAFLDDEICPLDGGRLQVRYSAYGKFAGCENYPACEYKRDLSGLAQAEPVEPETLEETCPECGGELRVRESRFGKFAGCANYPKCKYTKDLSGRPPREAPKAVEGETCPQCGAGLVERAGKRGPFVGCSAYPKCRYIKGSTGGGRPQPVVTELPCEDCGKMLVLRSGRRGPFLGCSGYPKCRFTREATAEELAAFPAAGGESAPEAGQPAAEGE
jgi:DNA topoisomerase-1